VIDAHEEMDLAFPRVNRETRKRLACARAALNGHSRGKNGKGEKDDGK
jgi:hypothetical protein